MLKSAPAQVIVSAVLWALVPLTYALAAETTNSPMVFTTFVEFVSAAMSIALFLFVSRNKAEERTVRIKAFNRHLKTKIGFTLVFLSGASIGLANPLFVYALSFKSDNIVTLIVESWPILAAVMIMTFIKSSGTITRTQYFWMFIALIGFWFLAIEPSGNESLAISGLALGAALLSTLGHAGTAVLHQLVISRIGEDSTVAQHALVCAVRYFFAGLTLVIVLILFFDLHAPTGREWLLIIFNSLFGLSSSMFYQKGMQVATSPAVTLLWFVSPVVSVSLISIFGLGSMSLFIIMGGSLMLLSNIFINSKYKLPNWALVIIGLSTVSLWFSFYII